KQRGNAEVTERGNAMLVDRSGRSRASRIIEAGFFTAARDLLRRFAHEQSGSYVVITALTMPVLLGMAGLGTEMGLCYYTHQHMQSAADSAALSAATASYVQGDSTGLATQAKAATAAYGFV